MNLEGKYLIAIDLDGTLLTDDKGITPLNHQYLNFIAEQGHKIVLASGRLVKGILPFYNKFVFDTPIISNNGLCIYFPHEDKYLQKNLIKKEAILNFLKDADVNNFSNVIVEMENKVLLWKHEEYFENFFAKYDAPIVFGDIVENLDGDADSLIFVLKDKTREEEFRPIVRRQKGIDVRYWIDMPGIGEFTVEGSDKAIALETVRQYYGIDKDKVIAFGDSGNDVKMLESVAHPHVMKNAAPFMHERFANVTSHDNNNDGIYYALTEFAIKYGV